MKDIKKVLIVDDMHESILPLLKNQGFDPVYLPIITRKEILDIIEGFHGLIIRSKTTIDKELVDKATQLKFVGRAGAGLDKLDEQYLTSKNITIVNAPEGNRDALAEHALGMLLGVLHRINVSFQEVKKGIWDREGNRGVELNGKVVGIYGVGYMGKAFAKKLQSLNCNVIGYDKYHTIEEDFIKQVSLEAFFDEVEILSIHIPLTEETEYLFDASYFARFKKLKVVVNTARGKILKLSDLKELLEQKKLYGAALDVLENEKLSTYSSEEKALLEQLLEQPNVLVTPHIGGWTYESYQRINEVLIEKLKEAFTE